MQFQLHSPFEPAGDQPAAIKSLVKGLRDKKKEQILMGVTGSGKTFTMANITHLLVGGALIIAMITVPLMADTIMQKSPLEGGLRLMRLTVMIPIGAILGGFLCQRFGYRFPTILGLLSSSGGFFFMSRWTLEIAEPYLTIHLAICGFGFGLVISPITTAILNAVVAEDLPGPGTVFLHVDWSFRAPVRPGDVITGRVEVLEVRADKPISKLATTVTRDDGVVVVEGNALCYTMPLPST